MSEQKSSQSASASSSSAADPTGSAASAAGARAEVLYSERQWVPWYFWMNGFFVIAITTATFGLNREPKWAIIAAVTLTVLGVWVLLSWSKTVLRVEREADGTRWLCVRGAQLPSDVVSRSLAVPKTARRNALGPQLDPAAFLSTQAWIDTHAMFVLDDPEDDTPYWLVATKNPRAVIEAFVPEQAAAATATLD